MKLSLPADFGKKLKKTADFFVRHRLIIFVVMTAVAIGYTTTTSQKLLSPQRNETTYDSKQKELNNFQTIDYKFAEQLRNDLSDVEVQVNQQLPSNRTNPFTE
ncbi:hypothetical protein IPO96_03015 [Candidatus Saccharibacteria bacterium]|jgi:tyrosine-protein phosphatase YwqE|nr:MAG: hypothetical protein IPO96_03015 [Candidatus Saccharibacteria bacterium]